MKAYHRERGLYKMDSKYNCYDYSFTTFMIFMIMRVPVTFSMLGACVITALYLGPKYVSTIFLRLGDGVQSFSFLAIPFFIFAGDIMSAGGISDHLVEVANVMVGRFRGGLAYVNVIASTFLAVYLVRLQRMYPLWDPLRLA